MNATAYRIADMAQTITYEAIRFPVTEEVALTWLRPAVDWAAKRGLISLARDVQTCIFRIEIQDADILELQPEQIVEVGHVPA